MRLRTRIALLFATLAAGLVLVSGLSAYLLSRRATFQAFSNRLELRAVVTARAELERDESDARAYTALVREHASRLPYEVEYVLPADSARRLRPYTGGPPPDFVKDVLDDGNASARYDGIFYEGILYHDNEGDYVVVVSARPREEAAYLDSLLRVLLLSALACILLAAGIGFLFAEYLLQPLRSITRRASAIGADSLGLRLTEASRRDELGALASAFNVMLDRIEAAFESQAAFVGHASHELNTPLTTIIGEAEYALARTRTGEQYRQSIIIIGAEAERLRAITAALLQLARTRGGGPQISEAILLTELLGAVRGIVNTLEEKNAVSYVTTIEAERAVLRGNRALLVQAVSNVVLNGCKYSGNAPVAVEARVARNRLRLQVRDHGIGIPAAELRHVFDPFFRASNSLRHEGYGIGLPLTRTILRIHGGSIVVESVEGGGTVVEMELPVAEG